VADRDDELLHHFSTLWKSAMVGLDTLRQVAVRSTQTGRLRVDIALLQRERSQLLETLGEMIVAMIDDGSFVDIPESVKQAHDRIRDVEQRLKNDESRAHDNAFGAPRGFEPEAASDYGDEDAILDEDEDVPADPDTPGKRRKTDDGKRRVTRR
jgi:hypothetical protein